MSESYLKNLAQSLKDLVGNILISENLLNRFLMQGRTISLSDSSQTEGDADIHLIPVLPYQVGAHSSDSELLKFPKEREPDSVLVFRAPVSASFTFAVACPKADLATRISDTDKLHQYFFNHRSIEPFLPEGLKQYPQLYQRMFQSRASLKPNLSKLNFSHIQGFIFSFEYFALYHSGSPIREERIVQRRALDMSIGINPTQT